MGISTKYIRHRDSHLRIVQASSAANSKQTWHHTLKTSQLGCPQMDEPSLSTRAKLPRSLASRKTLLVANRWNFHVRLNSKTSTRNGSIRRVNWQQRSVSLENTDSMKVLQAISLSAIQFKLTASGSTRSVSRSVTSANPILFS